VFLSVNIPVLFRTVPNCSELFIFVMTGDSKDENPEFSLSSLKVPTSTKLVLFFTKKSLSFRKFFSKL
jgi:hypothetical protein